MVRIVIIEDEIIAARNLQRLLYELDLNIAVVAKIESVKDAITTLPTLKFDLVLMDIHLSDGSSFQILENIEITEPIIFTTAFEKYVFNAFKQNSIDYLLKPISKKDLEFAITKYKNLYENKNTTTNFKYTELAKMLGRAQSYKKRFLVQIGKKMLSINTQSIAYFFVENKTTYIKTYDDKRYIIDMYLSQVEANLNPDNFFRINRQFLVNSESIENIYYHSSSRLKANLSPAVEGIVWVSTDKIGSFKKWLNK